jgi:4'-phosphopantetheinyl transferase EntD
MNIEAVLKAWLPDEVRFAVRDPRQSYPLRENELGAVANAIGKRQTEFSAGRDAARAALAQFGVESCDIPVGARRAPVWPKGFCGSITHSDFLCISVVAHQNRLASIGIDAEPDTPLKPELRSSILHESEQRASAREAITLFSMKEALFKALFPLTGEWMGFQDAKSDGKRGLELTKHFGDFASGTRFDVPTLQEANHVISFCAIDGFGT